MSTRFRAALAMVAAVCGIVSAGCESKPQSVAPPPPPEYASWSREAALARLSDPELGVRAAIRLVRLAHLAPLSVPETVSDAHVRQLRLARLGADRWALGLADKRDPRCLHAPILISSQGDVTPLATGPEEEALCLWVSRDADVFPHLAILPARVLIVADELSTAIVLAADLPVLFTLRQERGFNYVALVMASDCGGAEVARYRWDPYEAVFTGPAVDRLPEPPGGEFHIDLEASAYLEPVGGQVEDPKENPPPPDSPDEPIAPDEMDAV